MATKCPDCPERGLCKTCSTLHCPLPKRFTHERWPDDWPDYYAEALDRWPFLPPHTQQANDEWRNRTRGENAAHVLTALESVLSQVRDLTEQWEADMEEYPRNIRGTAAAAAVLACKKELVALLPPPAARQTPNLMKALNDAMGKRIANSQSVVVPPPAERETPATEPRCPQCFEKPHRRNRNCSWDSDAEREKE